MTMLHGHADVLAQFRTAIARGRLASTFLFAGPGGIGKRTFALYLSKALLCQTNSRVGAKPADPLTPCERCESCRLFDAGTHPDLHQLALPDGRSSIPLELLIGDREHRMDEGLCHEISLKPFLGGRKIAIIDDADALNPEGANSLLKTLEEPPPRSVLILLSERLDKQLPTIRSRAQLIRFQPLSEAEVAAVLLEQKLVEEPAEAARLAKLGEGSVTRAMDLADPALGQFRASFLQALAARPLRNVPLAKQVADFVDAAGKEASLRRARVRWLMGLAAEFYRELARCLSGAAPGGDAMLRQAAQLALNKPGWDVDRVLQAADIALDAPGYVDRNANQALVIDAWLEQLSTTITPAVVAAGR